MMNVDSDAFVFGLLTSEITRRMYLSFTVYCTDKATMIHTIASTVAAGVVARLTTDVMVLSAAITVVAAAAAIDTMTDGDLGHVIEIFVYV
jgi:hypothetical protein